MIAGTCLEHPHHEALPQFAQVPRMHMVVILFSITVDGGNDDFEVQRVGDRLALNKYLRLAIKLTV
jgi:hypothetical protein